MTREVIQLSPRGKTIYQLLSLIVALLPLYAAGFFASALNQLPNQPLVGIFEAGVIERVADRAFQLALLSGLVSAGLMMAGDGISVRSVIWLRRFWTGLAVVSVVASPFEVSGALDLAAAIALLLIAGGELSRRSFIHLCARLASRSAADRRQPGRGASDRRSRARGLYAPFASRSLIPSPG